MRTNSSDPAFLALCWVALFAAHHHQHHAAHAQQGVWRLPLNVIPSHYNIALLVKPTVEDGFTFNGTVTVAFTCVEATDTLIIHNYNLVVDEDNVVLQDLNGNGVPIIGHEYDWSYAEFHTMTLGEPLEAGRDYTLAIPYDGEMVTYAAGLWYGDYFGDEGREYFVATQLETTSARAAYPCFDEPGLKATFDISIGHPTGTVAFSNMPIRASATDPDSPYVYEFYERTPVMSTYLFATVIGAWSRVPTSDSRQFITIRDELAAAGDAAQAVDLVPAILAALEDRLQTPFPLPKLDHAGVPNFGGGMENYGLIIYDELGIADSGFASVSLMAHETSHMWTGDLVTCQWWDVTWLNEGMTHFFTHYIADIVDTTFDYTEFLATILMDNAMAYDSFMSAESMVVPIVEPQDLGLAFSGTLIYSRGGNIGRFLMHLIGEDAFLAGMKQYFADNAYQPVREEQLFSALQNAAVEAGWTQELDVPSIASPFTNQAGFPLVTVTRGATVGGQTTFTVSQKRYLSLEGNDHDDATLWPVPLNWATEAEANFDDLSPGAILTTESAEVTVNAGEGQWVIFNKLRSGYYRVNYDRDSWLLLVDAINAGSIPSINRAAIVSDGLELCYYSLIDEDVCAQLPQSLKFERNVAVWAAAARGFDKFIAKSADQAQALETIKQIAKTAQMNALRTREAMTPRRKALVDFLQEYLAHLDGPNAKIPFYHAYERFWNERFERKSAALKKRLTKETV